MKKIYKSTRDKKLAGVCGGLGEYFNIDPTIIRIIWAALFFAYGTGILAYIIAAVALSDAPASYYDELDAKAKETNENTDNE